MRAQVVASTIWVWMEETDLPLVTKEKYTIGIPLVDMHIVRTSKAKPALQQKRLPRVPKSKHKSEAAARSLKVFSSRLPLVGSPNAFGILGYKIQSYLFSHARPCHMVNLSLHHL